MEDETLSSHVLSVFLVTIEMLCHKCYATNLERTSAFKIFPNCSMATKPRQKLRSIVTILRQRNFRCLVTEP